MHSLRLGFILINLVSKDMPVLLQLILEENKIEEGQNIGRKWNDER